ncbi:MAG: hypothetical protein AMXMBFR33_01750 [Candidatus Xenobia bacterium]
MTAPIDSLAVLEQTKAALDLIRRSIVPPEILTRRNELHKLIATTCEAHDQDPERIAQAETKVWQAKQQLEDAKSQLEMVDAELYEDDLYQKASNDSKRKLALKKLRSDSQPYKEADVLHRQAKAALEQANIDVRKAENEMGVRRRRLAALQAQVQLYFGGHIE